MFKTFYTYFYLNTFLNMEIAENEENNMTNPV